MIVEISTHGSSLKRDHDCFIIQNINERTEIPAEKIDAINITANVLISTQAIRLCIEKNIQLVISDLSILLEENIEKPVNLAIVIFSKNERKIIKLKIDHDMKIFALNKLEEVKKLYRRG